MRSSQFRVRHYGVDQLTPEEIWKIVEFLRDKNRQRHLEQQ
jgi:hypothetical protein